jgi:hypothetical protein
MNFDAARSDALGPWITGFEFGGAQYGGQYRADTDSRVLRFITKSGMCKCAGETCKGKEG